MTMTGEPLAVTVRTERISDMPLVRGVVTAAFGRAKNADLIDAIRGTRDWLDEGSIVALDADGRIVGHVLLSRGRLVGTDGRETDIGMIGPVAVLPEVQGRGIGGVIVRAAIDSADARGYPIACLLGHPTYYPRFGFERGRQFGIEPQVDTWPDEAWMVYRLGAWTPDVRGKAFFPPAFD